MKDSCEGRGEREREEQESRRGREGEEERWRYKQTRLEDERKKIGEGGGREMRSEPSCCVLPEKNDHRPRNAAFGV